MDISTQLFIIIGMAVVTAIPRVFPLMFLSSRNLPERVLRILEMIPPAVLAALLAQEIVVVKTNSSVTLDFTLDNIYLVALLPTILIAWIFKNFFVTVLVGMGTVALLRYFAFD